MIKDFLDTIARNYLKSEECDRLADEFKYAYKVKFKIYDRSGRCKGKYKTIKTELISEVFKQMSEFYKDKSVAMLKNQKEVKTDD